ncbi:hypothetical protein pdam_00018817, partial [Pocillopora damicornis]
SSPCSNSGTCQAGFTYKGFRCVCWERFTGEICQVEGEMAALCGPVSRVRCSSSFLFNRSLIFSISSMELFSYHASVAETMIVETSYSSTQYQT